jgi:hypothetical protein
VALELQKDQIEESMALGCKMAELCEGHSIAVAMEAVNALQYALKQKAMHDFVKGVMSNEN